jgi:hypothetical protein
MTRISRSWICVTSFLFILLSNSAYAQLPQLEWALNIEGNLHEWGTEVQFDSDGNAFMIGIISTTTDVDPGPGEYLLTPPTGSDVYVVKLDPSGNFFWAVTLDGDYIVEDYYLTIDAQGNTFIHGVLEGSIRYHEQNQTHTVTSIGQEDFFIIKFDQNGSFQWFKSIGGTNRVFASDLTFDNQENLIIAGYFRGEVDFDPDETSYLTNGGSNYSLFLLKLGPDGSFIWVYTMSGNNNAYFLDVRTDDQWNIYLMGRFKGNLDINPGEDEHIISSLGAFQNLFILKLDANANYLWSRKMGSDWTTTSVNFYIDSQSNILFAGQFYRSLYFGNETIEFELVGNQDDYSFYIGKIGSDGSLGWLKMIGEYANLHMKQMTGDLLGNLYIIAMTLTRAQVQILSKRKGLKGLKKMVFYGNLIRMGTTFGHSAVEG